MGCINSKNDLSDINPNIYRVVNVNADGVALWSGQLEITPKELTLYRKGKEPTKWSLQHLRRYGFDADLFTFEAGRRCTTGEGIYAFKCRRAESLFHTLQSYIQGIALSDDSSHQVGDFVSGGSSSNGPISQGRSGRPVGLCTRGSLVSQTQSGNYVIPSNRPNSAGSNGALSAVNPEYPSSDTNYLEPTPIRNNAGAMQFSGTRLNSVGSGPISPEPNSPGSPNSFTILEVTQLSQQHNTYQNSNIYQEFPVKSNENNNNLLSKKLSLDIPPQEPAPALSAYQQSGIASDNNFSPNHQISPIDSDPSHMYVNVTPGELEGVLRTGTPTATSANQMSFPFSRVTSTYSIDPSMRCYENLEPGEFRPMSAHPRYSKPDIFAKVDLPTHSHTTAASGDKSEPTTPISNMQENKKVNYIVLDLDQSPSSVSALPNSSSSTIAAAVATTTACTTTTNTVLQNTTTNNNNTIKVITPSISGGGGSNLLTPDSPKKSSQGYAVIDFNKTVALSNTTASLEQDSEGSRKTRHSSTATRQSNSVSD